MLNQKTLKEAEVIQTAPPSGRTLAPLFLVHDGGGTTFAYHCLWPIGRAVFGIANPRFQSGAPWDGGLPEMARLYLRMIRNTVARSTRFPPQAPYSITKDGRMRRQILLGGWSLGGLLSLEIARLLATGENDGGFDEEGPGEGVEIVGLVLIDSVYPVWPSGLDINLAAWPSAEDSEVEGKNLRLARRAMKMAGEMLMVWRMPRCGLAAPAPNSEVQNGTTPEGRENGAVVSRSFYGTKEERETAEIVWERPPRAVLLKAEEAVPQTPGKISPVDVHRGDEKLGWETYCPGYVEKTLMVGGNHYDMFSLEHIHGITAGIADACRFLDGSKRLR